MRALFIILIVLFAISGVAAESLTDCAGVVRVIGDGSSWMSSCIVVGDGSWVITTADAVTERIAPGVSQQVRFPIFISPYTGRAYQAELKAADKDLNVALLKLPVSGLPAAKFAQYSEFSKAAYGTMGQLMSGEPVGNRWPTVVYGINREKSENTYKLAVGQWDAKKVFVTDIGKYKWVFLSEMSASKPAPSGSIVAKDSTMVGMYINKLSIAGGQQDVSYGRCAMSTEIANFLSKNGIDSDGLYSPAKSTVQADANADTAFQLYCIVYSLIGSGRTEFALEHAKQLSGIRGDDAGARLLYGLVLTNTGKFDEALKEFDAAGKISASYPLLRINRAVALAGVKKTDDAEAELLKAVQEAPSDVRPVMAIAEFYTENEKTYDKALTYAGKAMIMAPTSPAAKLLLAKAQKRNKDYAGAVKTLSELMKVTPDLPAAYFALGSTLEESGDKENAEKAYRKLVALQPKNPDAVITLASFLADNGKIAEAKETLKDVKDLNPSKESLDMIKSIEDKIDEKE